LSLPSWPRLRNTPKTPVSTSGRVRALFPSLHGGSAADAQRTALRAVALSLVFRARFLAALRSFVETQRLDTRTA
jgi:hypothetical protein